MRHRRQCRWSHDVYRPRGGRRWLIRRRRREQRCAVAHRCGSRRGGGDRRLDPPRRGNCRRRARRACSTRWNTRSHIGTRQRRGARPAVPLRTAAPTLIASYICFKISGLAPRLRNARLPGPKLAQQASQRSIGGIDLHRLLLEPACKPHASLRYWRTAGGSCCFTLSGMSKRISIGTSTPRGSSTTLISMPALGDLSGGL